MVKKSDTTMHDMQPPNLKGQIPGTGKMFETRISMDETTRAQVIELLNQRMADIFDLYSQTKQAHWNVKGRDFYQLHLLFDQLAEGIEDYVDDIAERITALGGFALGTVRMAAQTSSLPEFLAEDADEMQYVEMLAERYAHVGQCLREDNDTMEEKDDMGTSDLLTEIIRQIDKSLYFLEAHIQR